MYNNHFCLIWKSQNISFNQAKQELKTNFNLVGNFITEENVTSQYKNEFIPKEIESQLITFKVYDLENHNTDRPKTYNLTFYQLGKIAGKYNRRLTPYEI